MNSKIKVKYPIAIQWKISEAQLQEKRNSIDGYLMSTVLDIPGTDVKNYVTLNPNGNNEARRRQAWIFFHLCFEEKQEIEAEFTVSIETASYSHERKYVYTKSWGWGGGKPICTTDELFDLENRFIVNGFMVIKVEGFLMIEKNACRTLCKLADNENILGVDLWNHEFKDFAIIADGKEIQAHKIILSARSPVFQAMFQPHTLEAQENKVTIPDFSFTIVETAIKLCYDTRLVESIPIDDMIGILQFSDKYDIQSLKMSLEKLMILEVNNCNVCRFANGSITSNAPNLKKKCAEFLEECFRQRIPVNDFDSLDKDFSHEMVKNALFQFSL